MDEHPALELTQLLDQRARLDAAMSSLIAEFEARPPDLVPVLQRAAASKATIQSTLSKRHQSLDAQVDEAAHKVRILAEDVEARMEEESLEKYKARVHVLQKRKEDVMNNIMALQEHCEQMESKIDAIQKQRAGVLKRTQQDQQEMTLAVPVTKRTVELFMAISSAKMVCDADPDRPMTRKGIVGIKTACVSPFEFNLDKQSRASIANAFWDTVETKLDNQPP